MGGFGGLRVSKKKSTRFLGFWKRREEKSQRGRQREFIEKRRRKGSEIRRGKRPEKKSLAFFRDRSRFVLRLYKFCL